MATINHSRAVSWLHKALRRSEVQDAAYAAAYLYRYKSGRYAAWRRVMAFVSEDLNGEGAEHVSALYDLWRSGHEMTNLWCAILYLCYKVQQPGFDERHTREPGRLDRAAVELCSAALYWVQRDRPNYREVPDYVLDYHTGDGDLQEWWEKENKLAPASPWREDAMKLDWDKWKRETKGDEKNKEQMELPMK